MISVLHAVKSLNNLDRELSINSKNRAYAEENSQSAEKIDFLAAQKVRLEEIKHFVEEVLDTYEMKPKD